MIDDSDSENSDQINVSEIQVNQKNISEQKRIDDFENNLENQVEQCISLNQDNLTKNKDNLMYLLKICKLIN